MVENNGPEAEAIKAFFQLHGEIQASATCLILATLQSVTSSQISEWAIRAFFKYGGEPRLGLVLNKMPIATIFGHKHFKHKFNNKIWIFFTKKLYPVLYLIIYHLELNC